MNESEFNTDGAATKRTRPTVYESAIDWWVGLLLVMAPLISGVLGVYAWWMGQPGDAAVLFVAGAFSAVVTAAFTVPCRYTILNDAVSIRCGLICYQIPLSEIVTVERTASLKSGPSLSLKRVAIKTAKKTIIISPKDQDAFIADLNK
ncbi:MAG: PH domain-containing protein [Rubripirellula sp.]